MQFVGHCFDYDVDYEGYDLNDDPNGGNYGAGDGMRDSTEECQRLCQITKGCALFTYKPAKKECWLKTNDTGRTLQDGVISGQKYCHNEGE